MMPRLKIKLLHGWKPLAIPDGPATYIRGDDPNGPVLQFSLAHHKPGPLPNTTAESLIVMCEKLGSRVDGGRVVFRSSGQCGFGLYGTVVVKGRAPEHFQAWVLSNRRDFILITHIGPSNIDPAEIYDASEIALMTSCD